MSWQGKAGLDFWVKEIAPSEDLRKQFGYDPEIWSEFKERYFRIGWERRAY